MGGFDGAVSDTCPSLRLCVRGIRPVAGSAAWLERTVLFGDALVSPHSRRRTGAIFCAVATDH